MVKALHDPQTWFDWIDENPGAPFPLCMRAWALWGGAKGGVMYARNGQRSNANTCIVSLQKLLNDDHPLIVSKANDAILEINRILTAQLEP
jgi:hypothetical protein